MFVSNVNSVRTANISPIEVTGDHRATLIKEAQKDDYNIGLRRGTKGLEEIHAIKARLNEIALRLRESPENKDILEQIKSHLRGINKFFPPYPPGSEERVRLLKSFIAFRLLIERLTIPPEPDIMDMTDTMASDKAISIKESLVTVEGNLTINSEGIQPLF